MQGKLRSTDIKEGFSVRVFLCQKPVLAPLPIFCHTAGTTIAVSNSLPTTLQKRARETADVIGLLATQYGEPF